MRRLDDAVKAIPGDIDPRSAAEIKHLLAEVGAAIRGDLDPPSAV